MILLGDSLQQKNDTSGQPALDPHGVRGVWSDAPARPAVAAPPPPHHALRAPPLPKMHRLVTVPEEDAAEERDRPSLDRISLELEAGDILESIPPAEPLTSAPPPLPSRRPSLGLPPQPTPVQAAPSQPTRGLDAPAPLVLDLSTSVPAPPERARSPWVPGAVGFALGVAATVLIGALALRPSLTDDATPVASARPDEAPATPEPALPATQPATQPAAMPTAPALEEPSASTVAVAPLVETPAVAAPAVEAPEPPAARPVARTARREPVRAARAEAERPAGPATSEPPRPAVHRDEPVIDDGPIARPAPRTGDRPALPTRADVTRAMDAIRADLLQCAPEARGHVAQIRLTFSSTGRATSALVPSDFAASPASRSCVARTARRAQVPPFAEPRLVVTYPVQF